MSLFDGDIMEEEAAYLLAVKQKVRHIVMVFLATPNEPHPPGVPSVGAEWRGVFWCVLC